MEKRQIKWPFPLLCPLHSGRSLYETSKGKNNTFRRFNALVDNEFRERLLRYVDRYKSAKTDEQRQRLKHKISELNRRIIEAKKVWEQSAPRDA